VTNYIVSKMEVTRINFNSVSKNLQGHIFDEINENEIENNENNDPNLNEEDSEFLNEFIDIEK